MSIMRMGAERDMDESVVKSRETDLEFLVRICQEFCNNLTLAFRSVEPAFQALSTALHALSPLLDETEILEVPTAACFDCGSIVPISDIWTKRSDDNVALCGACFRKWETAGRARKSTSGRAAHGRVGR